MGKNSLQMLPCMIDGRGSKSVFCDFLLHTFHIHVSHVIS